MLDSIPQRIKQLAKEYNLSIAAFEKSIGAGNNTLGTAISKNSNISGAIINKIMIRYTKISPDWLITGTGPMLRDQLEIVENVKNIATLEKMILVQDENIAMLKEKLENCKAEKKSITDNKPDL